MAPRKRVAHKSKAVSSKSKDKTQDIPKIQHDFDKICVKPYTRPFEARPLTLDERFHILTTQLKMLDGHFTSKEVIPNETRSKPISTNERTMKKNKQKEVIP